MYNQDKSSPQIVNSIFWQNSGGAVDAFAQITNENGSTPRISSTLIQGSGGRDIWPNGLGRLGIDGGHNIDLAPLFIEPIDPAHLQTSAGNLRLTPGCSPAIDVGRNDLAKDEVDLDGETRIQGRRVDLGAYESTPDSCLSLSKSVRPASVEPSQVATYTLILSNRGQLPDRSVYITDTLPSAVDFANRVEQPDGAIVVNDQICWQGAISAEKNITFTFEVTHLAAN